MAIREPIVARSLLPIEDLEKLEQEFREIAETLSECVQQAREAGMPAVLIHVKTLKNTHLPEVKDWSNSVAHDIRLEANAYREGRKSRAEKSVERAQSMKKSAEKSTDKKPPGKPKKGEK